MSDDQDTTQVDASQKDTRPKSPEAAMQVWRDAINALSPLDYDATKEALAQFRVKIPERLLKYESYLKVLARLQNLRTDLLEIKAVVDEHFIMKDKAVRNLQKILVAMAERKTVMEKEGEAEIWLIHLQKLTKRAEILRSLTDDVLGNLDAAIMQVGRQIKVTDIAVRTQTIDVSMATDLPNGWGDLDDDDEPSWIRRNSITQKSAATITRGQDAQNTEGED